MNTNDRALLNVVLRTDLAAFIHCCFQTVVPGQLFLPNWHVEAIAHHLERCRLGEIRRLIINIPPRYLKSICASVAFPAFVLGHDPTQRCICISYSHDLAAKHARDCRAVMESSWYKSTFPHTRIDPRKNTELEFETTKRGFRFSTSIGGTLTGRGGNWMIIDDPLKPADAWSESKRRFVNEWYDSTLPSRLDSKKCDVIIIIMQRLHVNDLVGHLLDKGEDWTVLNLPAIADERQHVPLSATAVHDRMIGDALHPVREPLSVLHELKTTMGSLAYSAQYQQAPVPAGGTLIKRDWLRTYAQPPELVLGSQIIQSWDTASGVSQDNDYSVCTTWLMQGANYYLLHVLRDRLEFPALRRRIISHAEAYRAHAVLIEKAGLGIALLPDLRLEGKISPIAIRPIQDKIVRLESQTAVIEAGNVLIPESAPWLDDFLQEILAFPRGRHDDQVDSLSQFLGWASKHRWEYFSIPVGPEEIR